MCIMCFKTNVYNILLCKNLIYNLNQNDYTPLQLIPLYIFVTELPKQEIRLWGLIVSVINVLNVILMLLGGK